MPKRPAQPFRLPDGFWDTSDIWAAILKQDLAQIVRLIQKATNLSQAQIGLRIGFGQPDVSEMLSGIKKVDRLDVFRRIVGGFQMPDRQATAFVLGRVPDGLPTGRDVSTQTALGPDRSTGNVPHRDGDQTTPALAPASREEAATNRRVAMLLGGTTAAGVLLEQLWAEPSRMNEVLDSGSVSPTSLARIQQDAIDLSIRVVKVPPTTLLQETLALFRNIANLATNKQTLAAQRELVRCSAMVATVVGEILFNEGHFPLARQWYGVAIRSAEEAMDQYLADIALAGSTYLPTYTPDPRAVLAMVDPRLDSYTTPTPAIAWLWGFKAKAHAALGQTSEFGRAIERSHAALADSSAESIHPGIFSFVPEKLAFYEARGRVELGDTEGAAAAAERALSMYDHTETTEPALVRLEKASAFAQVGEVDEACRIAVGALLDKRTFHGITVITRAREFDRLLPAHTIGVLKDWREVLNNASAHRLAIDGSS